MANTFIIPDWERPIVEAAIGGAILDRLRNHKTSFADLYQAKGGTDPKSIELLNSYQSRLQKIATSKALQTLSSAQGSFERLFASWGLSQVEVARVERALGAWRLDRAAGKGGGSSLDHYTRNGGTNPTTRDVLSKLSNT